MKDPAFLFYSSDFLTGVSDLTFEERGQYITLLCLQHQKGRLSSKAISIAVPNATADVMAKFNQDDQGNFFNERLEIEAKKRAEHAEKQRQRAIDGWKKRKGKSQTIKYGKATANAAALPLENENENENRDKDISVNIYPSFSDFWELYDKKHDKQKAETKWNKLKQKEKEAVMDYLPNYIITTPDKNYRRNPVTFLNNRTWENELIIHPKVLKEFKDQKKSELMKELNNNELYKNF